MGMTETTRCYKTVRERREAGENQGRERRKKRGRERSKGSQVTDNA